MEVIDSKGTKQKVDIQKNITIPVLSVIAQQDDLVSPASSLAINDHISSRDSSVLENPGGHVALCISNTAHKKLWPEVAKWLLSRLIEFSMQLLDKDIRPMLSLFYLF